MKGNCLCGSIRYEVDEIGDAQFCHCRTCQLAQGAPYVAAAKVKKEHFRFLSGENLLSAYESSPGKTRCFCSQCGTSLFTNKEAMPFIALRLVTLEQDPNIRPKQHIWLSDECPWTLDTPDLPRYEKTPE